VSTSDQTPSDKPSSRSSPGRPRSRWILLTVVFVLAIGAALTLPGYFAAMMMGAPPASQAQLDAAAAGSTVEVAFEVTATPSAGVLSGNFLERTTSGVYQQTGRALTVHWQSGSTPIVMGQAHDVHAGAVLQVRGVTSSGRRDVVEANRIVVLTGSVKVR